MSRFGMIRVGSVAMLVGVAPLVAELASAQSGPAPLPSATTTADSASAAPTTSATTPRRRRTRISQPRPAESASAAPSASASTSDNGAIETNHEVPTATGSTGLIHLPSAVTNSQGTFLMNVLMDFFTANNFLCNASQPCTPVGNPSPTADSLTHFGAFASLSAVPYTGLELFLGTHVVANTDNQVSPQLLQTLGDSVLGVKYVAPLANGVVNLGGSFEGLVWDGVGSIGWNAIGMRLTALSTFDLRTVVNQPIRFHFAVDYLLDNSSNVIGSTENARQSTITRVERYGLGINRVDRFDLGLGAEWQLADDRVRAMLEYNVAIPWNRQGYRCAAPTAFAGVTGGKTDNCLYYGDFSMIPSVLTIGLRAYPFEKNLTGLSLTAALDIGVTGTSNFMAETTPTPSWTLWFGMSYATSVEERVKTVEKTIEKTVEVGPTLGNVKGLVHDSATNQPIPDAIIKYDGAPLAPLASASDGTFADMIAPGSYKYVVKAPGYQDGACSVVVPSPMRPGSLETGQADCALIALPKVGTATLTIVDSETQTPLTGVAVTITMGTEERKSATDASGIVHIDNMTPGDWAIAVTAEGYMGAKHSFEVRVREETHQTIEVHARPKLKNVTVEQKEIKIKQQVHFATDKATILADSNGLLEEVAEALIETPRIKKMEIQGHTDNTGTDEHNKQLSQARAEAVRTFLIKAGVPADRLEAKGYGSSKPIGPNINDAGRAKNRRVQFVIIEQDAAAKNH